MEIQEQLQDGILIVRVSRQIDSTTAPILGDRLDAVIGDGQAYLILDLSDVAYISSAGLRALSVALKAVRAPELGGDLYLAHASKTVAYAFRISGFDQVFCIYDTVDEALAAMIASRDLEILDGDWR
jgi:anti-sigma B factor antagonist